MSSNKTYYNPSDGHTYWLDRSGGRVDLMACPTFKDGTPDWDNTMFAKDFDIPLSIREAGRIMRHL